MIISGRYALAARNTPILVISGVFAVLLGAGGPAAAGDFDGPAPSLREATSCAAYGPDYAAVEGGTNCVRIGGHVRVQLGSNAGLTPGSNWTTGQAAPATLRSDSNSPDPMPTGTAATHLRIHGGLEYPGPFQ
ncbi:MAG: hypothetical protein P4L76_06165 [Beijerinckiaceae bacterium]|nr:hypothetical protein [Beijerinckiaceae bacterium]